MADYAAGQASTLQETELSKILSQLNNSIELLNEQNAKLYSLNNRLFGAQPEKTEGALPSVRPVSNGLLETVQERLSDLAAANKTLSVLVNRVSGLA